MDRAVETRFEQYAERVTGALGHADRVTPGRWYLQGLILPGQRKSVEPMAARVHPQNVRSAHQSMHHLVADSDWSDTALLVRVAQEVLPKLHRDGSLASYWIIDDTGFRKWGKNSVGVARQYCGQIGKVDNCQVAVTLSFATALGSLPLQHRLYLPKAWAEDRPRCERVGVPAEVDFATKGEVAWGQIEATLAAGIPRGIVLMDAGYGDEAALRDRLTNRGLQYAVGIRPATAVWHDDGPDPVSVKKNFARPCRRVSREAGDRPMSVRDLAQALPHKRYRAVTWRDGTNGALRSRFARVRVRAAHGDRQRAPEWLLIEWPRDAAEPTRYFLSSLSLDVTFKALIDTVKMRWRIERDYRELKQEVGLGHYEGRNWRGFHHHASLCIAAYGFLVLEGLRGNKKKAAGLEEPPLPEGFVPRGARPDAAPCLVVDRHRPLSSGPGDPPPPGTVPLLCARTWAKAA